MHALNKSFVSCAAAFVLTGCLVSETPLLDASNGRARPIDPGDYQSCSYSDGELDGECSNLRVSMDDTRLYRMVDDDKEVLLVRFRKFARSAYLAQTIGEDELDDDEGYMYFLARPENGGLGMTMLLCPDLPENLKSDLVESGEMEIESDGEVCVARTLNAALAGAKAYNRESAPPARMRLVFTAVADMKE
ncbi:MAG: hypothetical protein ACE5FO_00100 [Parvularculaceae bacterium]